MMTARVPLEFTTGPDPVATIILIHGLGASGETFRPAAQALDLSTVGAVRFVLPNAPVRSVSVCGGERMPAWYDLLDQNFVAREDEAGLKEAAAYFTQLIDREIERGMAPERIVIGGFSQGGAMSLMTGLRYSCPLAGIADLSGYLPLAPATGRERTAASRATPIFMGHGTRDGIVPLALADAARRHLAGWGYDITWRTYPMDHTIIEAEIRDLNIWLSDVLKPTTL